MDQLIKITTDEQGLQVVSARELHSFLESKQRFSDWIKGRIEKYGLIEGQDYLTDHKIMIRSRSIEYILSVEAAKELAMVEGNEKGRQARQYFIACEKALRQLTALPDFSNPALAARAWAEQYERQQVAETTIRTLQPKVDFAEAVMQSNDLVSIGDMARILAYKGLGQNNLFEFLRSNGILLSDGSNRPYQKYIEQGWCKVVESKWRHPKEGQKIGFKTVFTQKGMLKVRELLEKAGFIQIIKQPTHETAC